MKQTLKKYLALLLALVLVCSVMAACGSSDAEETEAPTETTAGNDTDSLVDAFLNATEAPEEDVTLEYDANGTVVPGTYTYEDYKADMDFSIVWTFILYEDGSYDLNEDNPFIGVAEYGGQTSETDGNRVNCGEMDADRTTTAGDRAYPTGFSILVDVDTMTNQPENISDEVFGRDEDMDVDGEGSSDEASAQTYVYDDYKEMVDAHIIWTLVINADGSFTLTEDNPFGGVSEYAGTEATVDGDQIICGAMDPAPEQGDWAFPEGFTVQITGEGTFEPTEFESFGETAG